jgi:hypothetical protein
MTAAWTDRPAATWFVVFFVVYAMRSEDGGYVPVLRHTGAIRLLLGRIFT